MPHCLNRACLRLCMMLDRNEVVRNVDGMRKWMIGHEGSMASMETPTHPSTDRHALPRERGRVNYPALVLLHFVVVT